MATLESEEVHPQPLLYHRYLAPLKDFVNDVGGALSASQLATPSVEVSASHNLTTISHNLITISPQSLP